jgi:hypothetical protein
MGHHLQGHLQSSLNPIIGHPVPSVFSNYTRDLIECRLAKHLQPGASPKKILLHATMACSILLGYGLHGISK